MDPPPPSSAAADTLPTTKIRLLCRYGGHIVPKPNSNSLAYVGGDTKIVSLHRSSISLSSLTSHLSRSIHVSPFLIKYQLPGEDLDALVSVSTDEDLRNMIEEHERLPPPARIRVFLFPARTESLGSFLKSDLWLCDALEGASLTRRGVSADSALLGMDDVAGGRGGLGPESMVMETGSSFGSTGSSVSMTNLPAVGAQGEENRVLEKKTKLPSSGSIESDNNTPSAPPHQQYATTYHDPSPHLTSSEAMARPSLAESANVYHNPSSNFQPLKTVQAGTYQASNQITHQQDLQYIQAGSHYIPQYTATPSYYPMYYPPLNQPTHNPYQQNHPYPVYYVPVRPTEAYNTPTQYNLVDTSAATPAPTHPLMHIPATKEVVSVASTAPLVQVPSNQNQQQLVDISDVNPAAPQSVVSNELDDEFVYTQIYKTQPSGPTLISQYQTMTSGE